MTAPWPSTDHRLERAYRRLLWAYPGRFRRRHGTELVTTLLEMAGPQQHRPDRADAWHLVTGGVRQRFRLPAGRPLMWVMAVLITVIAGAFGAAAGSWAGERTFPSLSGGSASTLRAVGTGPGTTFEQNRSPWHAAIFFTDTPVAPDWDVEQARQRFTAAGWTLGPTVSRPGLFLGTRPGGAMVPLRVTEFHAVRDGVQVEVHSSLTPDDGTVSIDGWATPTGAYLPLVAAGTLLGLVAGWLLAAGLAYRILRSKRPRPAAAVTGTAMLVLALPAVALYGNVLRAFRYAGTDEVAFTVHSAFSPGPYYPFGPEWQVPALAVAGVVLAATAALIARPGPAALSPATG